MHTSSYDLMKYFVSTYNIIEGRVLEVGSCDINGNYRDLFQKCEYIGCDIISGLNVDIVLNDPYNWQEFANDSFDTIISGSAFEHIEYPWLTMQEIYRILKPNGYCCIIAPMQWEEHRFPVDCYRFLPGGLRALLLWGGLEPIDCFDKDAYNYDKESQDMIYNPEHRDCIGIGLKNAH